jgi:hypothetical protein
MGLKGYRLWVNLIPTCSPTLSKCTTWIPIDLSFSSKSDSFTRA